MRFQAIKRIMITILAAVMVLTLTACGSDGSDSSQSDYQISEVGTWKDGVYTETAEGKKGSFDVTVTIEDGMIVSIEVGDNEETADKGGVAIAQLPEQMIENQTYDVDAVSSATVTSDGLKDAVAKCLERASE